MPYGQSPWEDASSSVENVGAGFSRIALARAIGRQRAQQFAQQMALREQALDIQRQRAQQQGDVDQARIGQLGSATDVNYQKIGRQDEMDELARQIGMNVFRRQLPGGIRQAMAPQPNMDLSPAELDASPMGTEDVRTFVPLSAQPDIGATQGGPTVGGLARFNQADLVRNVMQLISMHNPNELGTMMLGKDISRGAVNYNPVTGEQIMGPPAASPKPDFRDPETGMTPYQVQQLILQRARLKDAEDYDKIRNVKAKEDPMYKMGVQDESESSDDESESSDEQSADKELDAQTASQFLQRAGGDKDKARQMAKDAGYKF